MTLLLSTAVSLSGRSRVFYEEDGVGTVCVVLSRGQLDGTSATVALSSSSGSASSGSEITPHHQPLVPPPHLQVTIFH